MPTLFSSHGLIDDLKGILPEAILAESETTAAVTSPCRQGGNHSPEISVTYFESAIFSASTRLGPFLPRSKLMVPLIFVVGPFGTPPKTPCSERGALES
jgi:hypothetical protein